LTFAQNPVFNLEAVIYTPVPRVSSRKPHSIFAVGSIFIRAGHSDGMEAESRQKTANAKELTFALAVDPSA